MTGGMTSEGDELLRRLESDDHGSDELDAEFPPATNNKTRANYVAPVTQSFDAALAFAQVMFPRLHWMVNVGGGRTDGRVEAAISHESVGVVKAYANTPALAILAAVLRAGNKAGLTQLRKNLRDPMNPGILPEGKLQ